MGSNVKGNSVEQIGRCLNPLNETHENFDEYYNVHVESTRHSFPSDKADRDEIIKVLLQNDVLSFQAGREHKYFPKFICNVTRKINEVKTRNWMESHYQRLLNLVILQNY